MFILKTNFQIPIRLCHHQTTHIRILKDALGMSYSEATRFLQKIKQKDPDKFLGNIKMCQSLGYKNEEIKSIPNILNGFPMVLEQHYMTLEEGGFKLQIPIHVLMHYRKYYSKSIEALKYEKLIPKGVNVAKAFGRYFNPQPEEGVIDYSEFSEEERWRDVHHRLLKLYLRWRLKASTDEIEMLFRIHQMASNKSVRLLCENIHLALEAGLSLRRIVKSGYVLHSYPKYTKEVFKNYGNIAGGDLKKAILSCPKLLMVSPKNFARIYGILKEHEISDEAIRNQLNIFQFSPQTIKFRLEEIEKTPELKVLKHHEKFLKLVVHHQRAKSRLCFLQELQMKCLPLKILSSDLPVDKYLRNAKDINDPKEVISFVKMLLKCDPQYFEKHLIRHPCYLAVPVSEIEKTYNYLNSIKFSDQAICRVASLLLYPKEKIKDALLMIRKKTMGGKMPINQTQRLNLVLYSLEKDHHFTGNGIWDHHPKDLGTDI